MTQQEYIAEWFALVGADMLNGGAAFLIFAAFFAVGMAFDR
jgi:hypothetical protein